MKLSESSGQRQGRNRILLSTKTKMEHRRLLRINVLTRMPLISAWRLT